MSGKSTIESSSNVKTKKNAPSATTHQGEEREGPFDIWAVVELGNTKEKIIFFADHHSSWDIDGKATKGREKKSGESLKSQDTVRKDEGSQQQVLPTEPFACGIEHCSVHYVSDSGNWVYAGRLLSSQCPASYCMKNCTNSPAVARFPGQARGVLPASEPFSAPGACEESTERGNPEVEGPQSEDNPGTQANEGKANRGTLGAPDNQVNPLGSVYCCLPLPAHVNFLKDSAKFDNRCDVEMTEELPESPFPPCTRPQIIELPTDAVDRTSREFKKGLLGIIITVPKVKQDQPSNLESCEYPRPGMLAFCFWFWFWFGCFFCDSATEEKGISAKVFVLLASPVESTLPVLKVSNQEAGKLLEPQQDMTFMPRHLMVKIFRLLPTKSFMALKDICCCFKFIIEYCNIRPADSGWVRDPQYREDPCKQYKKKYMKEDVSLGWWQPKPYCQTLPYGPGYWMCCHRFQKGFPGCKLGPSLPQL
ncbi:unnamed protein product [Nyctereutes procyonoides]|uniref:(raccoon dog) hypothetical protein n=1 Tax=Nyctereutes procyonoides TaxID=34880 RepID=A0A811Z0D8_NYCPR|nr:unnamed protein product [Nyctereutes procyonoides]